MPVGYALQYQPPPQHSPRSWHLTPKFALLAADDGCGRRWVAVGVHAKDHSRFSTFIDNVLFQLIPDVLLAACRLERGFRVAHQILGALRNTDLDIIELQRTGLRLQEGHQLDPKPCSAPSGLSIMDLSNDFRTDVKR